MGGTAMTRRYPRTATQALHELGGIGTGNVSLGSRGELRDWELANRPGVGVQLPYTFFAIQAVGEYLPSMARVLEGEFVPPFPGGDGLGYCRMAGLPRFAESGIAVRYPFAKVDLHDPAVPLDIELEAFTPFVPLDSTASGLPVAVLRYAVTNRTAGPVTVGVAGSVGSPIGIVGWNRFGQPAYEGQPFNQACHRPGLTGVLFRSDLPSDHPETGSVTLASTADDVTVTPEWTAGYWQDGPESFWQDFAANGRLAPEQGSIGASKLAQVDLGAPGAAPGLRVGSVASSQTIAAGQTAVFEFILAWHFPNRRRGWEGNAIRNDAHLDQVIKNFYATMFEDALDVAEYVVSHLKSLEARSRLFADTLHDSTMPEDIIDSVVSGIATLRSTTCFRIEDGTFLAWEGSFDLAGSCEGTCTHVWNYAQTAGFLFPELEASARRIEFLLETNPDGAMAFRTNQVFGSPRWDMEAAADGQLGCVVRLYREWRNTADDALVRQCWSAVEAVLGYALEHWDTDGDLVLDGEQHTTYDIEFHGRNSMVGAIFLAALRSAQALADALGLDCRRNYGEIAQVSAERLDAATFSGQYYLQDLVDVDQFAYQYGEGVLSDQLFGQFLADMVGLGDVLPREHVVSALEAVVRHNFVPSLRAVATVQRTYALQDEAGLVLCRWPNGGRPKAPFVYSDEVWTGVEYHVAACLLRRGLVGAANRLVTAARQRYDGVGRSPWNEVECGYHYARSMSGWGLLLAYGGFDYEVKTGRLAVAPAVAGPFRSFFSAGTGWGRWLLQDGRLAIEVLEGQVKVGQVHIHGTPAADPDWNGGNPTILTQGEQGIWQA